MKPQWLDRNLIRSPYHPTLCTTPAGFAHVLKYLKVPQDQTPAFVTGGRNATVHYFESPQRNLCAVACISPTAEAEPIQIAALLVHEAVHIWQAVREDLNERSPSSEFEAYAIQAISQELMYEYARQAVTAAKPPRSRRAAKRTRRTA